MNENTYRYTQDHEWVHLENNVATIGVSNHAVEELGQIVFVECPEKETHINQKEEFGTIESVKTVSSLYAPISGKVVESNQVLENNPETINNSPYDDGWLIKVEPLDTAEFDDLMTHKEYTMFLETL